MSDGQSVHGALCARARRWLSGTRRCDPVYSNQASCAEIPDAIGWSSSYSWQGSTVIECKASVNDFYADQHKRFEWTKEAVSGFRYRRSRMTIKEATEGGYEKVEVSMMGDFRFYLCMENLLPLALVEKHAPDHGLLYLMDKRSVRIVKPAPRRPYDKIDKDSEIRYLRFAILKSRNNPIAAMNTPTSNMFTET